MTLYEMEGFLRGKCLPSDIKVNETNAEYLVRKLSMVDQQPEDYFAGLVLAARIRAEKAMLKFPQPNYVLAKLAEEHGEVVKEVVHYAEGRGDWSKVEYELIDNLAMMIRLVKEGDQTINFIPPESVRR